MRELFSVESERGINFIYNQLNEFEEPLFFVGILSGGKALTDILHSRFPNSEIGYLTL